MTNLLVLYKPRVGTKGRVFSPVLYPDLHLCIPSLATCSVTLLHQLFRIYLIFFLRAFYPGQINNLNVFLCLIPLKTENPLSNSYSSYSSLSIPFMIKLSKRVKDISDFNLLTPCSVYTGFPFINCSCSGVQLLN